MLRERLGRAAREYVVAERQWPDLVKNYRAVYLGALDASEETRRTKGRPNASSRPMRS